MRLVALPLLAALVLTGCGTDPDSGSGPDTAAASPTASAPSSSPSAAASASASAAGTVARAVYWVGGRDKRGPRLYREFVRRPAGADPVRDSVEAMLALAPVDPDYDSLWADGTTVRDARREGTTAVVDLSPEARTSGGGSAFEAATLQQLVHTVTAAVPSVEAVRLLVDGQPVETLWGAVDTSEPLRRQPAAEILGPVWVDLQDGASLPADGSFGGVASVFEATVSWQWRSGDRIVKEGFSTATDGAPARGEWKADVDVPAGSYVLWAFESSAEDGSITFLDTKRVTVTG